jgi:hypothetical protein
MESRANERKTRSESGGYRPTAGYGYSNAYGTSPYGYGAYGYGSGSNDSVVERSLKDYLLILRERIWYIILTFLVVVGAALLYSFTQIPLYQSQATVEIFRRAPSVMQMQQVLDANVSSTEDFNTQINILKSAAIIRFPAPNSSCDPKSRSGPVEPAV